jgi:hypothetical protein
VNKTKILREIDGSGFWSEDFPSRKAAEVRADTIRLTGSWIVSVENINGKWTVCCQSFEDDYSDLDDVLEDRHEPRRHDAGP